MKPFITTFLSLRRRSAPIRYAGAAVLVCLAFGVRIALDDVLDGYPVVHFFPALVLGTLWFGVGPGLLAVVLSTTLALPFFAPAADGPPWAQQLATLPGRLAALPPRGWAGPALFVVISLAVVSIIAALHDALDTLAAGEEQQAMLLREIYHRIRNDLQSVSSLLMVAESRAGAKEAGELAKAGERVRVLGLVYSSLQRLQREPFVPARAFLGQLVENLAAAHVAGRPIAFTVEVEDLKLPQRAAVTLGLAANELLTNALKYAFPAGRPGTVAVRLGTEGGTEGQRWVLRVEDDGVGLPPPAPNGESPATTAGPAEDSGTEDSGTHGTHHPRPPRTGLGHLLLEQLARQCGGQLGQVSDGGVKAWLAVPATPEAYRSA
ncbi:two-component sensor histidine kinase [Nitrospirillum amazonense]|uniref:histidine kinase n=1 Tax=Nitrospirillum amazonense TaxID=28077 RepID=A0A560EU20_9PROT|nr:histidine kinase dimerization/phosphoacceptor domain -containing protein [Nitrospirillum amazonense]TWB12873.1 two-component sensor histidine kinase [Nitrospirillum amazonense]